MTGDDTAPRSGLPHMALDEFLGRARAVADPLGPIKTGTDSQLGLLKKPLSPLKTWTDQWSRVQGALSDSLGSVRPTDQSEE